MGAPNKFVRSPFLIEGALKGTLGGLFALLLTWVANAVIGKYVFNADFFDVRLAVAGIVAGALIGLLGSAVSVGRHLNAVLSCAPRFCSCFAFAAIVVVVVPATLRSGGCRRSSARAAGLARADPFRQVQLQRRLRDLQTTAHDLSEERHNLEQQALGFATSRAVKTLDQQLGALAPRENKTTANLVRAQDSSR